MTEHSLHFAIPSSPLASDNMQNPPRAFAAGHHCAAMSHVTRALADNPATTASIFCPHMLMEAVVAGVLTHQTMPTT
jgi:hypothetical protein